jgi:hypothetical protein
MLINKDSNSLRKRYSRLRRGLMCFVLLVLALRFIGVAHHDHGFTENKADCASCFMAHQLSDVPPPAQTMAPLIGPVIYPLLRGVVIVHVTHARKILPQAQGPPASTFPA